MWRASARTKTASWQPSLQTKNTRRRQSVCTRIGFQSRRLDAGNRAHLVFVRSVARNAAGADDIAGAVAYQDAARIGDHATMACRRQHREKLRRLGRAAGERARAETHAERAPGFAERDVEPQDAGFVLALERDEMAAGIEHGDGERSEIGLARLFQGDVDN